MKIKKEMAHWFCIIRDNPIERRKLMVEWTLNDTETKAHYKELLALTDNIRRTLDYVPTFNKMLLMLIENSKATPEVKESLRVQLAEETASSNRDSEQLILDINTLLNTYR